mmetsp:Transcript_21344/g.61215  ORF Transcript_21344/g.61215 Transcript_21344/m.61215 type:complete len:200 (+) Transcript_21344:2842-3441(+)
MNLFCLLPAAIKNKAERIVRAERVSVMCYGILFARNLVCALGVRRRMITRPSYSARLQRLFLRCCPFRVRALVKRTTKVLKCGEIAPIQRNTFCLKSLRLNWMRRATLSCESLSAPIRMKAVKSGHFRLDRHFPRMLLTLCKLLIVGQPCQEKGRFVISSKRWFPSFGLRATQSMKRMRTKGITFYTCGFPSHTTRRRY